MRPLPACPEEMTAGWLAEALHRRVFRADFTRIGVDESFTGGALHRLRLTPGDDTLIAKFSPSDPALRAAFARANRREVEFYTRLGCGLPVPDCAFAGYDDHTGASVLLLQDLRGHRAGSFITGLGQADMRAVVRSLAQIHARWWGSAAVDDLPGSDLVGEFDFAACWSGYPAAVRRLMPEAELPRDFLAFGDYVAANWRPIFTTLMDQGPLTVLHHDCHADNVMFAPRGQAIFLDWQIMARGRGVCDLAYALIGSMRPDLRRHCEDELVAFYHGELLRRGVTGYDRHTCQAEYRRAVISKLFVTVVATVLLDNSDAAKRAWRRADLERLLAFVVDHRIGPGTVRP